MAYLRRQVPGLTVDDSYLAQYWTLYPYQGSAGQPPVEPEPPPPVEPPPGGTIFDQIIAWIKKAISDIIATVTDWITRAKLVIIDTITTWVQNAQDTIMAWVKPIWEKAVSIWDSVANVYNTLIAWLGNAWSVIYDATSAVVTRVWGWIRDQTDTLTSWVSREIGDLRAWVTVAIGSIPPLIASIGTSITSSFTWLTEWLPQAVLKPMQSWFDSFKAKVFDFQSWVGQLGDAVWTYLMHDVPGSSPFIGAVIAAVLGLLTSFLIVKFPEQISAISTSLIDTTIRATAPVSNMLMGMFTAFVTQLSASVKGLGVASPERALGLSDSLVKVGATVITGLIGMTVAGEFTVLGSKLGLGNISAMIYDLTNYKVLTGAFVGALAYAAIQTPLRYYYQNTFRPMLPREGDASAMFARDRLSSAEYRQLLGYQGLPDQWHERYEDLAYRPMSLVALSTLANTGYFDEEMTRQVLVDRGINPKWRSSMLEMYRRKGLETTKGMMSSVPINRYKRGYTTLDDFDSELDLLGYSDKEIVRIVQGAGLAYATDYIDDLISAWQSQVRKKVMSLDAFRLNLATVIRVPDRVDALVMREIVNAPVEEPKAVGMSIAVTRFKEGMTNEATFRAELELLGCPPVDLDRSVQAAKLAYNTDFVSDLKTAYTDAVRNNRFDMGDFRQALLDIGIVPERTEAYVLIETCRIDPFKKTPVPKLLLKLYETDLGKVEVDTIRRQRRKGQISRDEELVGLMNTGYTPSEAAVIARNDDARLAEKSPAAE